MNQAATLLPGVPLVESPLFEASLEHMGLTHDETRIAIALHTHGFAVIDFPDPEIEARIGRIRAGLAPAFGLQNADAPGTAIVGEIRIQDAWRDNPDVRSIATNPQVLALLGKLYGRRAIPFQTLNFPVGTQQHPHSDAIHFSSQPERFMCGVWLAMEDVTAEAGPLIYLPGSHRWPILSNIAIGRNPAVSTFVSPQTPFEFVWKALIDSAPTPPQTFLARKGQALIWAANLLHGGAPRLDPASTRWSQVTHYYFADCVYYTPAFSIEPLGKLDLRVIVNLGTGEIEPNRLLGEEIAPQPAARAKRRWWHLGRVRRRDTYVNGRVPADFDPQLYLLLNPDVAAGTLDARTHYVRNGRAEGRRYKAG